MSLEVARRRVQQAGLELRYTTLVPLESKALHAPPSGQRPGVVAVHPDLSPHEERVALYVALQHQRLGHAPTVDDEAWCARQHRARRAALAELLLAWLVTAAVLGGLDVATAAPACEVDEPSLRERLGCVVRPVPPARDTLEFEAVPPPAPRSRWPWPRRATV